MSYSLTYSMMTGGSRRNVDTAQAEFSAHVELILDGAGGIVIQFANGVLEAAANAGDAWLPVAGAISPFHGAVVKPGSPCSADVGMSAAPGRRLSDATASARARPPLISGIAEVTSTTPKST